MTELAELVIEIVGSPAGVSTARSPPTIRRSVNLDISLARSTLGWRPTIELPEELAATVEYFRTLVKAAG